MLHDDGAASAPTDLRTFSICHRPTSRVRVDQESPSPFLHLWSNCASIDLALNSNHGCFETSHK
jgi:hypothetical protein